MTEPTTEAGRRLWKRYDEKRPGYAVIQGGILAIEAEARATVPDAEPPALDAALYRAVLKFYADQMPAYAVAAGLTREEYAAVMVDVRKVRARLAREGSE